MVETSFRQLLPRIFLFFTLFILISGVFGSWVVSTNLLFDAGFWVYGNIGKLVLLLMVFLGLQIRKRTWEISVYPLQKKDAGFIFASLAIAASFFFIAYEMVDQLYLDLLVVSICHLLILLSGLALFVGSFGVETVKEFIRKFSNELKICILLFPLLYLGIFDVWKFWPILSSGVLTAVNFLLSLTFTTRIVAPFTLWVNDFGIEIAESCSGIDSLFMFSMLYLLVIASDWNKINKKAAFFAYLPLGFGLYIVNIVRVYVMVLIGVLWSPEIAIHAFHTYAGMVFFFIYFLLFFKYGYGWLKVKK